MSGIALRFVAASVYPTAATLAATTTPHWIKNEGLNEDATPGWHGKNYYGGGGEELMPAILLGAAGENSLLAWSRWAEGIASSHRAPPALWVICSDSTAVAAARKVPRVNPFFVRDKLSWATVLRKFLARRPHVWGVGLLGEGALPHPGLMGSIESMRLALFEALPPTAVLTRSRSKGDLPGEPGRWLSDKFVSQLWCNRAALEAPMLAKAGLTTLSPPEVSLLHVLPRLVRDAVEKQLVLVDGTHVIGSIFDAPPAASSPSPASGNYRHPGISSQHYLQDHSPLMDTAGEAEVYIGTLEFALVYDGGDFSRDTSQEEKGQAAAATAAAAMIQTSSIVKAPWPPAYILETVAMNTTAAKSKGLVLVSNVNCGYLGMATNFLLSVRNTTTSDTKVLFVAMDVVSFDFMDALDPGCATHFPSPTAERRHSAPTGRFGDSKFAELVFVRPKLLHSILSQGYAALWSDSDMVWLGNPLPLLPRLDNTTGAGVMLQYDGKEDNKCTCFIFLKPTMMCRMLLKLWEKELVKTQKNFNQLAFQKPLAYLRSAGLRVDFLSPEVMPAGKHFFDHDYEENYLQLYHEHALIVHNNWIKGHHDKKRRFQDYHLWSVDDTAFPKCGDPSDGGHGWVVGTVGQTASEERLMIATGAGVSFMLFAWYASTFLRTRLRRSFKAAGRSGQCL